MAQRSVVVKGFPNRDFQNVHCSTLGYDGSLTRVPRMYLGAPSTLPLCISFINNPLTPSCANQMTPLSKLIPALWLHFTFGGLWVVGLLTAREDSGEMYILHQYPPCRLPRNSFCYCASLFLLHALLFKMQPLLNEVLGE